VLTGITRYIGVAAQKAGRAYAGRDGEASTQECPQVDYIVCGLLAHCAVAVVTSVAIAQSKNFFDFKVDLPFCDEGRVSAPAEVESVCLLAFWSAGLR
jgi:hypothetical protein